jgi:hypothetical protein
MELWESIQELGEGTDYHFNGWVWEWFCTFNLGNVNHSEGERYLRRWRRKMAKKHRIQIASVGVYNTIPQSHIHMLMLGRDKYGASLHVVNHREGEAYWSRLTRCSAKIIPIFDDEVQDTIVSYIVRKNMPWRRSEMLWEYNGNLLQKERVKQA